MFPNVHVIQHLGANLAPWNFADFHLEWRDDTVMVEGRYPLLFFHFHGVKRVWRYYFNSHRAFHAPFPNLLRQRIYRPYIAALAAAEQQAAPYLEDESIKNIRKPAVGTRMDHLLNAFRQARGLAFRGIDVVTGRAIAPPDGSVR
jgi:hypothetical protein